MDASVAGASSHPLVTPESRMQLQAGPLPKKRGEIGYVEGEDRLETNSTSSPGIVLPARHPADRDAQNLPPATMNRSLTSDTASTMDSVSPAKQKGRQFLGLFKCNSSNKQPPKIHGIEILTLSKFIAQFLVLCGTIVGWVFVAKLITSKDANGQTPGGPSTTIFMHVLFAIATLAQLLLLERRLFRVRAERYSYLHPGEVLPRFGNQQTLPDDVIALSPWNRPPLPTYAAAIAQSGQATGDVEDNVIAQQPPPAYGNTRGSTFLLSGFLNENLRLQRPASVHSATSVQGRPKSYASRDDEWEVVQDADRARQLEETLARLERGGPR